MATVALQANAFVAKTAAVKPRAARRTVVQAAGRPTWYPGATPPANLDGSLPGGEFESLMGSWAICYDIVCSLGLPSHLSLPLNQII